jgi:hypothetical protein
MDVGRVAVERDGRDPRVMSDRHFDDERIELSERRFDGISVGLYWTRGTDLVVVTVTMTRPVTLSSSSSPTTSDPSMSSSTHSHSHTLARSS